MGTSNVIHKNLAAGDVHDSPCSVLGVLVRESAGTPAVATVLIRDTTGGDTGNVVIPIELAGGASTWLWFGPQGIRFNNGVRVEVAAGTVEGSVLIG